MTDCTTAVSNNQAFEALAVKFGFHHHLKTGDVLDRLAIDAFIHEQNRENNPCCYRVLFFHFHWCSARLDCFEFGPF